MAKPMVAGMSKRQIDDWEVESALETLLRAEEITKDKNLMTKVKALAKKKDKAMTSAGLICGRMSK